MWKIVVLLFCCSFLFGCVEKSSNSQSEFKASDAITYQDEFKIRGKTIPLPPGEWRIISSGLNSQKLFQVYFIQEHTEKIFSSVVISVDSLQLNSEFGYKKSETLDRLDLLYKAVHKNTAGEEQDWWYVNNYIFIATPKNGNPALNEAIDYMKSHGFVISSDYILVRHLLTGKHPYRNRFLEVSYYYNPEVAGFPSVTKSEWATSDWNSSRINAYQQKVQYIDDLVEDNTIIHEKLKAGFHPE